ncbi:NAD(P)H-binding protein [Aliidiomarina maris]|uniref:NAD-dependent dehydratase n=1 Tax=Aliidiomarina maris TaxID=531312 RepID=A0A327WRY2_9GAMM|nr:NAD(P)H-binding protein [Aliidiomarina maris]RAJ94857.1 uncharacterized protein YbjT (DUF2867 family) [Aliidiomarina maris]RUO20540.1 NAD-dependent dehydratase [Aliidiomarina maris]
MNSAKKLLLVGATGAVGKQVLTQALNDSRVASVVAPVRRELPAHPKLLSLQVNFEQLEQTADWWQADAVICALGTTMRRAGSQEAFRRVDYDYPLHVAKLAHEAGTPTFVLNSAMGADAQSRFFYNRVKGELEQSLRTIGFTSLTLARPGLIGGPRDEFRLGERVMSGVLSVTGPILPKRWRINPAAHIAAAMLDAALAAEPGEHIISSEQMI